MGASLAGGCTAARRIGEESSSSRNAGAELALKKRSVSYYESQLDGRILPALGSICLFNLSRAQIEGLLSDLAVGSET